MSLEQQISKGIMEAMKAKDTVRLSALRNAKKYIIEAKTAGPEIAELPDADVLKIISKLALRSQDHTSGRTMRPARFIKTSSALKKDGSSGFSPLPMMISEVAS